MKKLILNFLFLLLTGGLVYGLLVQSHSTHVSQHIANTIQPARLFYHAHPFAAVVLFWCAHLIASCFSIPGSCTVLNTLSGGIFGFWVGCTVVYPITIVSAILVYFFGKKLRGIRFFARRAERIDTWSLFLTQREFMFFVTLRLSPLLPFGLLNIVMGVADVPFPTYLLTTVVGVFFDVTLLNNLGAGLMASSSQSQKGLAITFFVLLFMFFLLQMALTKTYNPSAREPLQK